MKLPRQGPSNARIDYRWRVDREEGFEKTSMIYGRDGRLVGIDYESAPRSPAESLPKPRGSMPS